MACYEHKASWQPFYDFRIADLKHPVYIILKGKIQQSTGEDWKNIKLTISTGNLSQSNNQPELTPWILSQMPNPMPPFPVGNGACETTILGGPAMARNSEAPMLQSMPKKENQVEKNQTSIEYHISGTYDVESKDQGSIVEIIRYSMDADYVYQVIPKAECSAFLTAYFKDWKEVDFLKCDANIFLQNRYVGATYINPEKMDEKDGKLVWRYLLGSSMEVRLNVAFRINWPKELRINL